MTSYTKHLCIVFSIISSVCTVGRSEEPEWPKRILQFEVQSRIQARHRRTPPAVTHMALVHIGPEVALSNLNLDVTSDSSNGDPSQLLKTPAGQTMSEKQKELLSAKAYMLDTSGFSARNDLIEGKFTQYRLYGISEDDARKMAQALVELCDIKGRARLEDDRKQLDKYRKLIPEAEKKIAELDVSIKAAETQCSELRKIVSYRKLSDALQDVVELDKALRALQVEMAGNDAKVSAIRKLQDKLSLELMEKRKGRPSETVLPGPELESCNRMLVAEDVERAGILARKVAIEGHRQKALQYCTIERQRMANEMTKQEWIKKQEYARHIVPRYEKTLANPPAYMKPLIVLDNPVLIYPLTPPATSSAPARGVF